MSLSRIQFSSGIQYHWGFFALSDAATMMDWELHKVVSSVDRRWKVIGYNETFFHHARTCRTRTACCNSQVAGTYERQSQSNSNAANMKGETRTGVKLWSSNIKVARSCETWLLTCQSSLFLDAPACRQFCCPTTLWKNNHPSSSNTTNASFPDAHVSITSFTSFITSNFKWWEESDSLGMRLTD